MWPPPPPPLSDYPPPPQIPDFPAPPPLANFPPPPPLTLPKSTNNSDTFPRINGNVASQIRKISEQFSERDLNNGSSANNQFVTKVEIGTKRDLLTSRDFRGAESQRTDFTRSTDLRTSLRSEPSQNHLYRDSERHSLRAFKRNDPTSRRSAGENSRPRRSDFPDRGSRRRARITRNSNYVKRITVNKEPCRSWPGSSRNYTDRGRATNLQLGQLPDNRCFKIRHHAMSPIGEEAERGHDSIVTTSLLQMTSFSPTSGSNEEDGGQAEDKGNKEDMNQVINQLSQAVMQSKGVSTLTRAVSKARRSQRRSVRRSLSRRSSRGRRSVRSRTGTLRNGVGVEAVKDLWEKSGMKTNGRKLLLESEDEGEDEGRVNLGYESDLSELSVPRRYEALKGHRKTSSQSSTTTYDSVPAGKEQGVRSGRGSWELRGARDLETDSRHVRFSSRGKEGKERQDKLVYDQVGPTRWSSGPNNSIWERYYGSTAVRDLNALETGRLRPAAGSSFGSGFTLDQVSSNMLRKNEVKKKKLKCFCQTVCVFLLLSTFLLVIVAVSILLTRGKNHFGSM